VVFVCAFRLICSQLAALLLMESFNPYSNLRAYIDALPSPMSPAERVNNVVFLTADQIRATLAPPHSKGRQHVNSNSDVDSDSDNAQAVASPQRVEKLIVACAALQARVRHAMEHEGNMYATRGWGQSTTTMFFHSVCFSKYCLKMSESTFCVSFVLFCNA
jgi:hypothetical protein